MISASPSVAAVVAVALQANMTLTTVKLGEAMPCQLQIKIRQ
jgi:hypothetical protein